jgi:signal transduction histidine kinase
MTRSFLTVSKKRFALAASCLGAVLQLRSATAQTNQMVLTNAADVLALTATQARPGLPVSLRGVVTAAESNWAGRFFVQDDSGGVFVDNVGQQQPKLGDLVTVTGISHPGGYAPVVSHPHWKKAGTAPMPEAKRVPIDILMSGSEDSQRVAVSGIIRTAKIGDNRLGVEVATGGYRVRAFSPIPPGLDPQSLIGDKVLLRGTLAAAFNAPLRHFITVTLFVPQLSDFIIQEAAPTNPFAEPLTPLNAIAQYRKDATQGSRVHVKGVVMYQENGAGLFIQDRETNGLQIRSKQLELLAPGDAVEAVGFSAVDNYLPVLDDAIFRQTGEPRVAPQSKEATASGLLLGIHHADLITMRGRLIDRLSRGISQEGDNSSVRTTLVLQTSNLLFTAERDTSEPNQMLASIPLGSLVEISGICLLESGSDGKIKSVRVLLPSSHDVRIIQKPGWLTPQHLLVSLAVVLVFLVIAVSWTVMVTRRNAMLKSSVREKIAAQNELQSAHDQLEERVKERTAQLKVEMTARKESELQFRATLTERTRLAQELHDTLEQTMTGIALQLDMVAKLFNRSAENALHHLKLARNLMRQSQVDVRRSVWGLRSRATEQFNLTNALGTTSRQIASGAGINVEIETAGETYPLSEIAEENLLRVGQEAITNVVKHSGARAAKIQLEFTPQKVILQITDNGKGFAPQTCVGPKDGHFGLLGMTERAERLGGQIAITSENGRGTSVRVEIPASPANQQLAAAHS